MTNLNDVGPACGCLPRLSRHRERHSRRAAWADRRRGAWSREALCGAQNATVHVISRNIMNSASIGPANARDND
jgi:hypothetical protein